MLEKLLHLDEQLFITLNGLHTPWLDQPMFYMAKTYLWIPVHALLIFLIIYHYKKNSWVIILCIALSITMSDRITSGLMKPFFERLRPSHEPHLEGMVHIVNNYKGGLYGFASSHAANTFALAIFILMLFGKRYKWITWIFLWAIIVTYTRIYLGVHYPGDVIVGGLIGTICGLFGYKISQWVLSRMTQKTRDQPI